MSTLCPDVLTKSFVNWYRHAQPQVRSPPGGGLVTSSPGAPVDRLFVDRSSPVPLYFQLALYLEKAIESGEMAAGGRLDNELQLAAQLGLSRPTVRRAIQYLVEKGLLVRKRGVGTSVVHAKVRRGVELTSLYDDLARSGQRPTTKVLFNRVEPANRAVAA